MDIQKTVGSNFARLRHKQNMTQEKVSELSGLSQQYLSDLERGKRNPTLVTLQKIADAIEVDIILLIERQT